MYAIRHSPFPFRRSLSFAHPSPSLLCRPGCYTCISLRGCTYKCIKHIHTDTNRNTNANTHTYTQKCKAPECIEYVTEGMHIGVHSREANACYLISKSETRVRHGDPGYHTWRGACVTFPLASHLTCGENRYK